MYVHSLCIDLKGPHLEPFLIRTVDYEQHHQSSPFADLTTFECGQKLLEFAASGQKSYLEKLLQRDAVNLDHRDAQNNSGLHRAIQTHHAECAKLLITHGANVNARGVDRKTPLSLCVQRGDNELLAFLIDNGAATEAQEDDEHLTPLLVAARDCQYLLVKTLLQKGANIHALDSRGWTALHYAADRGQSNVVMELLDSSQPEKPDLEAKTTQEGWTPLVLAAHNGHKDVMNLLLDAGADAGTPTRRRWTALMVAAEGGHEDVVRTLLKHTGKAAMKGFIDATTKAGRTALMWAAQKGRYGVAELLIEEGADVKMRESEGKRADEIAFSEGYRNLGDMLRRKT